MRDLRQQPARTQQRQRNLGGRKEAIPNGTEAHAAKGADSGSPRLHGVPDGGTARTSRRRLPQEELAGSEREAYPS